MYPAVEALNALLWLAVGLVYRGETLMIALYCALCSALIVIALIDHQTFRIPDGLTLFVLLLGLIRLCGDLPHWRTFLAGASVVSVPFLLIRIATKGKGIGLGDVKLMAAAGLLLGWRCILAALMTASAAASIIHLIRMRRGAGRKLAFGPYLAAGIMIAALVGERIIRAYLQITGLRI